MPDIGTILGLVDSERRTRIAQLNTQAEERLVRWRCPDCGVTMCGFLRSDAPTLRYCRGIPRKSHYAPGEVCGQVLEVVSNAPARVASGR